MLKTGFKNNHVSPRLIFNFFRNLMREEDLVAIDPNNILPHLLKPNHMLNLPNSIIVNGKHNRVLMTVGYPRIVELGFLDRVIRSKGDFDISIHVHPFPVDATRYRLNKLLMKQKADLLSIEKKGADAPSLRIQYEDTLNLLRQVEKGEEKVFDVSLYINVKGKKAEEIDLLANKVRSELDGIGIISRQPTFKMKHGLQSVLPLSTDRLKALRSLTTSALAECFPFTSTYLIVDEEGIILGMNKSTGVPVIKNIYGFMNPNSLITGTSGSGKSYFAKLVLSRQVMKGVKVMIIDPNGEYKHIVKVLGGEEIKISKDSDTMINVFDLLEYPYDEKRLSVIDAFNIMLGGLTVPQKSVLDTAITLTYEKCGINNDPNTWQNEPPIIEDLYDTLMEMKKGTKERQMQLVHESLIMRVKPYVFGAYSFLNKQTKLNVSANPINFNIREMPRSVRPVIMYMILDYIYSTMRKHPCPKMLVVDEAWYLLERVEESPFLFEMVKTSRKFYLALMMIVQEIYDLIRSRVGEAVLANTSCKYLFRQDPSVMDEIVKTFHLNPHERKLLLTSEIGEGILIADVEHVPIKIIASEGEDKLITTSPKEFLARESREKRKKPTMLEKPKLTDKEFDPKKGLFKADELTKDQINVLKRSDYVMIRQSKISAGRGNYYYIKPRLPSKQESLKHLFVVKVTEEILRQYTDKIKIFQTKKPDIVFKDKKGRSIAVEVETGETLKNGKKMGQKIRMLRKKFKDNYFIIVTDATLVKKYSKFGETITRSQIQKNVRNYFE